MENSQLLELVGKTETDKLIQDVKNQYAENFIKKFPNYFNEKACIVAKAFSLITVTKDKEIKSIGMSCIDDLLNDNFGQFLKGIIGFGGFSSQDENNNPFNYITVSTNQAYNMFNTGLSMGAFLRIGKGTAPATRQDFNIEVPFVGGAEANFFNVIGLAGWNSGLGQISISGAITAGGSGSISETVLACVWRATTDSAHHRSIYSRDNISPVSNFIIGETINVNYTLLMS